MALEIQPLLEADLPEYTRIHFAAFVGGLSQYFGRATPERDHGFTEGQLKAMQEEPTVIFLKCVDTETGAIVACAKYHKYDKDRSEEDVKAAYAPPPPPPTAVPEAWNDLMQWLEEVRMKYVGDRKMWFLSVLITDPIQHRRGAGSLLLRWGCERADADNLPIYLESSMMAFPLYERFGYKPLLRKYFDLAKYGGEGISHNTAMIRQPKSGPGIYY